MPTSLVFSPIHLLIEPVDNRPVSVDNIASVWITSTDLSASLYPRYWTALKNSPYILYNHLDFSVILVNLAHLFPRFHPQFYPHLCLLKTNPCCLQIVSSCYLAPTTSYTSPKPQLFPLPHKPYCYYIYKYILKLIIHFHNRQTNCELSPQVSYTLYAD